jgi:hypothetical protein
LSRKPILYLDNFNFQQGLDGLGSLVGASSVQTIFLQGLIERDVAMDDTRLGLLHDD